MQEISRTEQERLLKFMRKHRKRLESFPNVRTVDVGYEFKDGEPTGKMAVRVHVDQKLPTSKLKKSERLPEKIDGIPIDVIESHPALHAVNRDARQNPIVGGVNVGSTRPGLTGTLGAIVFDRDNLQPMAISNYHIMVVEPVNTRDTIAQPKSTAATNALGTLARFNKPLDCAVCWTNGRKISTAIADLTPGATGIRYATIGTRVVKSGRTTGITRGIIDGYSGGEFTVIPDPAFPAAGGEISAAGDSGSLWLDVNNFAAVGLHFAGETDMAPENERAWAKSMFNVSEKLGITIFAVAAMGKAHVGTHCTVVARTRPGAPCFLRVGYPSGRRSTAKGLGPATADADGWARWTWLIGTSTKRQGAGTGAPQGIPVKGFLTLDGAQHEVSSPLFGNPTT